MNAQERMGRVVATVLQSGRPFDRYELMQRCGIPDTEAGEREFDNAVHWARMHRCRELRRELVTDRSTNLYFMPQQGDWKPLIYDWLPTVFADGSTRVRTIQEMQEVWRLNHAAQIPPRVVKRVNRLIRLQQEQAASSDDLIDELRDLIAAENGA